MHNKNGTKTNRLTWSLARPLKDDEEEENAFRECKAELNENDGNGEEDKEDDDEGEAGEPKKNQKWLVRLTNPSGHSSAGLSCTRTDTGWLTTATAGKERDGRRRVGWGGGWRHYSEVETLGRPGAIAMH